MPKLLIVDDDKSRLTLIKRTLVEIFDLDDEQIDESLSINHARTLLRKITYSVVFLDMALPNFDKGIEIDDWGGVKILSDISRGRVEPPEKIIGYTALKDNLEEKEREFSDIGFSLDYAKPSDISWLNNKKEAIRYAINRSNITRKVEKDYAVVTVHGIRTFGSWQEFLFSEVKKDNNGKDIEHLGFKFVGIDFFTFLFPSLRKKIVSRLESDLVDWLKNNKAKQIIFFSHSFGTYLTVKALENIKSNVDLSCIKCIVLSGSVLDQDYDFSKLDHLKNITIVNDCAVNDVPLLISEAAVLGTGMAGLTGFRGLSSSKVTNRFFRGGHSMFFNRDGAFLKKYWLPIFNGEVVANNEEIKIGFLQEFFTLIARISSHVKMLYPLLLIAVAVYFLV
ncbi:hypothetical protein HOP38_16050 [Vibrio mediterranei]|uniref:hypothetical protein n=1 Tax=Vibrio mediterranei TaxID=689 RepID=UPI0017A64D06|nr:hypothetical protein [Vibrio mediterranei]NUW74005.1 hypothetical protein [Vibrio mediterranei]